MTRATKRVSLDEIRSAVEHARAANPGEEGSEWEDAVNLVAIELGLLMSCSICSEYHWLDDYGRCSHCKRSVRGHRKACAKSLCSECERTVEQHP